MFKRIVKKQGDYKLTKNIKIENKKNIVFKEK